MELLTVGEGGLRQSGVPTADCLHQFPRCGLQINCTDKQDPTKIKVQGRQGGKDKKGVTLPGADVLNLQITGSRRSEQFEEVLAATKTTLCQGENVVVHCKAGRRRAAVAAAKLVYCVSPEKQ